MGNTEAKLGPEFANKLNYYQFDRNIDDYRIGKAQIWVRKGTKGTADGNNPGEQVLVKEKWSMTAAEASKYDQYMKLRKGIKHPNLCDIIETESIQDSSWCSKYYKTHIATEFHSEHLAEELNRRRRLTRDDPGKWMSEPSLWYLIKAVSSAALELERNGLLHGDIQPRNILITADERIKLFEAPMLNQYFTGFNRMLQEADYSAALSPQELDALRHDLVYRSVKHSALTGDAYEAQPLGSNVQQQVNNQIKGATGQPGARPGQVDSNAALSQFLLNATNGGVDNLGRSQYGEPIKRSNLEGSFPDLKVDHVHNEKDDVFSLGITSLCAITNNPVAEFYDMNNVTLNEAKINQKLQFLRELNYSQQATSLITSMIQTDANRRPTMAQVLQACAPGVQVQAPTVTPLAGGNFVAQINQPAKPVGQQGPQQQQNFGAQQAGAAAGVNAFNQGFNQAARGAPQGFQQQGAPQGFQQQGVPQGNPAGFQGQAGYQAPAAIRQSGIPAGPNPYYGAQSQFVSQPQPVYGR